MHNTFGQWHSRREPYLGVTLMLPFLYFVSIGAFVTKEYVTTVGVREGLMNCDSFWL